MEIIAGAFSLILLCTLGLAWQRRHGPAPRPGAEDNVFVDPITNRVHFSTIRRRAPVYINPDELE